MNPKQVAVNKVKRHIAEQKKMLTYLEALPDELPGEIDVYTFYISLTMPYNPCEFKRVRRMLGADFKLDRKFTNDVTGDMFRAYTHKTLGFDLTIILRPTMEGATCKRVQTGEKVIPVYEVVCG
jgi:hypothetical protein